MLSAKETNGFVFFKTSSFILCLPQHLLLILQKAKITEKKWLKGARETLLAAEFCCH